MTDRPRIVCLCGSTRFGAAFRAANIAETLAGRIVLSIATDSMTDDELFAGLSANDRADLTKRLADLHFHKISLADEVLIINVGGYIGEATRRELELARRLGKPVRYWEPAGD